MDNNYYQFRKKKHNKQNTNKPNSNDQKQSKKFIKYNQRINFIADVNFGTFTTPEQFCIEKSMNECYIEIDTSALTINSLEYSYKIQINLIHRTIISPKNNKEFIIIIKNPMTIHIPSSSYSETQILDFTNSRLINRCRSIHIKLFEYNQRIIDVLKNVKQGHLKSESLFAYVSFKINNSIDLKPKCIIEHPTQQQTIALFQLEGLYLQGIIAANQITKSVVDKLSKLSKDLLVFFKKQATMKAQTNDYLRIFSIDRIITESINDFDAQTSKWKDEEIVLKMEANAFGLRLNFGFNETNAILEDFSPEFRIKMLRVKCLSNERRLRILERRETELMARISIIISKSIF